MSKTDIVVDYDVFGNCLVIDRHTTEQLLTLLGCVNVEKWDTDFLVRTLKRVSVFGGVTEIDPQFQNLINDIRKIGVGGVIVIRSDKRPTNTPIALIDRVFTRQGSPKIVNKKKRKRGEAFSFAKCGIPVGATLVLKKDPSITCTVIGDPYVVDFNDGQEKSFTERTRDLLGSKESTYLSPMHYWMYKDKLLRFYYREFQCDKKSNSKNRKGKKCLKN